MTRKTITIPFVLAFLAASTVQTTFAQEYNFSVSVGLGTATPLGEFASQDADKESSGGAIGGSCFDIELKGLIPNAKGLGSIFMLKNQVNSVGKNYLDDAGVTAFDEYSVGSWVLSGYMGGAFYEYRTSEKFFIQPKLMVGALTAKTPSINLFGGNDLLVSQNPASSTVFSSLLGIDFGVDLGRFRLQGQYDFMFAKPTFNVVVEDYIFNTEEVYSFSQRMRTYNVKFSVGYNFGKR
jgi:hypothetical protein